MRCVLIASVATLAGCTTPKAPQPVDVSVLDTSTDRIQELLAKLDDNPDLLHSDLTPSVHTLREIGEPAISPTLPYLLSENEPTRLHAERVIDGAMMKMHGFVFGQGWPQPEMQQEYERVSKGLWDFEAMGRKSVSESPMKDRQAYIERVKRWLTNRRG